MAKLSNELQSYFFEEEKHENITLADILLLAGERIFGSLLVILSLPPVLPVPTPAYSTPFGVLISLLAIQLISRDKTPCSSEKTLNHRLLLTTVQGFLKAGLPWLRRIKAIARRRLSYICTTLPGKITLGVAIALMAISMMIPIPGTNNLPVMGIFVTAFGLSEDDRAISLEGRGFGQFYFSLHITIQEVAVRLQFSYAFLLNSYLLSRQVDKLKKRKNIFCGSLSFGHTL